MDLKGETNRWQVPTKDDSGFAYYHQDYRYQRHGRKVALRVVWHSFLWQGPLNARWDTCTIFKAFQIDFRTDITRMNRLGMGSKLAQCLILICFDEMKCPNANVYIPPSIQPPI